MRLKRDKYVFMAPEVTYLGHRISEEGIQPTQEKVRAIINAPKPQNVSQLKAFLGLLNYYCKFLPNLALPCDQCCDILWTLEHLEHSFIVIMFLLWGNRVVIPPKCRNVLIEELHMGHPGIVRMKMLARSYLWWPKLDDDIEASVMKCTVCQMHRNSPPTAPVHSWDNPTRPWSRVHADYAGPFLNHMFLVVTDAFSKWMEVEIVDNSTSHLTIENLQRMFAVHGIPDRLVTDNASIFTSSEFENFATGIGIRHLRVSPYHPASNGLAERSVQIMKKGLRMQQGGTLQTRLSKFLFHYRLKPNTVTGVSPAELLLGRKPKTKLDLIHPDMCDNVKHHWQGRVL